MIPYFRILAFICVSILLSAMSCDKNESSRTDVVIGLAVYTDSSFCHGLAQTCPKLAAFVEAYPPRLEGATYFVHAELLSYLLDSIADPMIYGQGLPGPCPGVTREQIRCAMGEPFSSGGRIESNENEFLIGDSYSYSRDPKYGLDPTLFWREPYYTASLFYNGGDTLVLVEHNGI
ncbi:MAG: hypothetical protein AB8F78_10805 [Saprospiraceae bacterium]